MNTGIQDAYNFAWKMALVYRCRAPLSLLDTYEKERRPVAEDVLKTSSNRVQIPCPQGEKWLRSIKRAQVFASEFGCEAWH